MGFTPEQKDDFLKYLESIAIKVIAKLPSRNAGNFLNIVIDYNVDDKSFEHKIAKIFSKLPYKFDELKDEIKDLSIVRQAMLGKENNSKEAREITVNFYSDIIDNLIECAFYEESRNEDELNIAEKKRRQGAKADKKRIEKQLQELKNEQQNIFEQEKSERIKRKEQKQNEVESVRVKLQAKFDEEREQRIGRKEKLDLQIKKLQVQLQSQHDLDTENRKKIRIQKQAEMQKRRQRQIEDQEKQANERLIKKENEQKIQKIRQQELQKQRDEQALKRKSKKEKEEKQRKQTVKQLQKQQSIIRSNKKTNQGLIKPETPIDSFR